MISKLLSLLSTAKGAAAATLLAAGAVGTGVVATNTDVQSAVGLNAPASPSASGKPAVVAARNDADKALRTAFQNDQQKLEKLRGTHVDGADRAKLNDVIGNADAKLRARLAAALDAVAALTLGREGHESASPKPSSSPDVKASFTADAQTKVDAIVKTAVADMDKIAADAEAAVAALPTANPGKPSDLPGGKPTDLPGGKPSDVQGAASEHPSPVVPSAKPTR